MPRKNVYTNLTVLEGRATRLAPPPNLSPREIKLFVKIVNDCEAKHFRASDEPQLLEYIKASIASEDAHDNMMTTGGPVGPDGDINPHFKVWEKLARRMAIQGTRLRLTPASRIRPEAVERKKKGFAAPSYYDTMPDEDDEDDVSTK